MKKEKEAPLAAYNYCVSFIDLLGQRDALRGESLLPTIDDEDKKQEFIEVLKNSVGKILQLQENAKELLDGANLKNINSNFRNNLPDKDKPVWDSIMETKVNTQQWSDGIVSYANLGNNQTKCPLNGVFSLFALAGGLCFLGLGLRTPLRGAIDVAWGVELRPGELYGAVVARAYELESKIAQYPRIVVSDRAVAFLEAHKKNNEQDIYSQVNREIAGLVLEMLAVDTDGVYILNYLGGTFRNSITQDNHKIMFSEALKFAYSEFEKHRNSRNSKLAFRYAHLISFIEAHKIDA